MKKIFKNWDMFFYFFQKSYFAGTVICLILFFISCHKSKLDNPLSIGDSSFFAMQGLRCAMGQDSVFCPHENPWVISVSPADSTTSVSIQNTISVTFNKPMNSSTLTTQGSDGTCSGSFQVSANDFSSCVGGTLTSSNPSFTFTPNPNLCVGNTYKVKITTAAKDLVGNSFSNDYVTSGFSTINPKVGSGAGAWVTTFAISCNTLYAGGTFTIFGGQSRNYLASVDLQTGNVTSWDPNPNGQPSAIAISGSTVYIGGAFTTIAGTSRNYIASFNKDTGILNSWNPNSSGSIYSIAVSGDTVYIGGSFTTIGVNSRTNIASIDATTGLVTPWNSSTNNAVYGLTLNNSTLYVAGSFNLLGGSGRVRIGALNTNTASLDPWNPNPSGGSLVNSTYITGNSVFVCGNFTNIGGQSRTFVGELDISTALATNLNLIITGASTQSVAKKNNLVYIGGSYSIIGGQSRNNLSSINYLTGLVTSWNPNPDNALYDVKIIGNIIYVVGMFANISGQPRGGIAAFDEATGSLLP